MPSKRSIAFWNMLTGRPTKSSRRRKKIQPDLPAHCWSGKLWTGEKCWNCWGSHQEKSPPDTDTRAFNPLWDSSGKILQTGGIGLRICTKQRFCYEYLVHSFVQRTSLRDIYDKVAARQRISEADALRLFESKDLNAVGAIADLARQTRLGERANQASYIINRYIN